MAEQRLPRVGQDDGTWGDILRQFLMKEHTNDNTDNAANGGHQHITITGSNGSAGTAPITFTSGTLLGTAEAGAMEFAGDHYYLTTSGGTRKKVAMFDDTNGAQGDLYYRDGTGHFIRLPIGSTDDVLTVAGGVPTWQASSGGSGVFADNVFTLQDNGDNTKQLQFDLAAVTAGQTTVLSVPDADTTIVGTDTAQTVSNKTFDTSNAYRVADDDFQIRHTGDATRRARFDTGSVSTGTTRVLTVPDADMTIVGTDVAQTLTNKTLDDPIFNNTTLDYNVTLASARLSHLYDVNGWQLLSTEAAGPEIANRLRIGNALTGDAPWIEGLGDDTDVDLDLRTQGAGTVKANGIDVATISGSQTLTNKTLTSPVINDAPTGTGVASVATADTLALRDSNANLTANALIPSATWTTASGGVTTLTIASTQVQAFDGSTSHTVRLPSASVTSGMSYTIVNATSGPVGTITVQASDGTTICALPVNGAAVLTTGVDAPTTNGNWVATAVGAGKTLGVLNSLTFAGTDGTTMTFPGSSDTVAGVDAAQTLTNKTLTDPKIGSDIYDTNGARILGLSSVPSATRWLFVSNADDSWFPFINVDGDAADIDLGFAPKGAGRLYSFQPGGDTTTFFFDGNASDINVDLETKGAGVIKANGVDVATVSDAQTLTNKRITKRVATLNAPGATPTINVASYDQINFTGINAAITSLSSGITGTPTDGQSLLLRFKDDGTARSLTWGANWRAIGVSLPTTTIAGKTLYVGVVYNSADSIWDVIAVGQEA